MAKSNGGIIGPDNIPSGPLAPASGVWRLQDAFKYQSEGLWPQVTGITYPVANSLRFNSASTEYLQRTPASAGSLTTWTYSFWTKRSKLATAEQYLSAGPRSAPNVEDQIYSISTDAISWYDGTANSTVLRTSQLFRDVSAWYHLMFVWDTTNATAGNRARIYVNGTEVTAFSIDNNPSLNAVSKINGTGQHRIGQVGTVSGENLDGYLAEVVFIDGQALTPSSFGETDTVSGNWKPKDVSGLTFGTNGFYLQFQNSGALGTDSSGNGNTWTVNNLTSVDQSKDTPTNNFATLNALYKGVPANPTFSNGNLTIAPTTADYQNAFSTIAPSAGKWYMEMKVNGTPNSANEFSVNTEANLIYFTTNSSTGGRTSDSCSIKMSTGEKRINGTLSSYGTASSNGDIMMCALDLDNQKVFFGKNGTWFNSGDPVTGTNPASSALSSTTIYFIGSDVFTGGFSSLDFNFGNPPYAANGYSDGNGFGDFSYAVPTGYYALNTQNINVQG